MYRYYQGVDDSLVYWRRNAETDLVDVYIADWDNDWKHYAMLISEDLERAVERGEAKEINFDPVEVQND